MKTQFVKRIHYLKYEMDALWNSEKIYTKEVRKHSKINGFGSLTTA